MRIAGELKQLDDTTYKTILVGYLFSDLTNQNEYSNQMRTMPLEIKRLCMED